VKDIVALLAMMGSLIISGCSLFAPAEKVRTEPTKTVYRATEEIPSNNPDVTPVRQKVPGESR
jgi:hypothetical protein